MRSSTHRLLPAVAARLQHQPTPPLTSMQGDSEAMQSVHETHLHTDTRAIPARIYVPLRRLAPLPLIAFFHGGSWSAGDVMLYDTPCRALAKETGCVVAYIDYRLAPAHPFPAALEDCHAAVVALTARAAEWGCDPTRIVVAGDSAGGNLAAATCLLARDRGNPSIAHQVLIYPPLDATQSSASHVEHAEAPLLSAASLARSFAQYAGQVPSTCAWISPLLAPDLSGLPGATLVSVEIDPVRDDALHYAQRLNSAGVAAHHMSVPDAPHMAFHMRGVSPECAGIYAFIAQRLRLFFEEP